MIERNEHGPAGSALPWLEVLDRLPFNGEGLLPAVAQQNAVHGGRVEVTSDPLIDPQTLYPH